MCSGMEGAWGWGTMFLTILFWLLLIVAVAWLILRLAGGGRRPPYDRGRDRAEDILRERYARGEIDQETYERMMDELRR